jgi:hypothetical protein
MERGSNRGPGGEAGSAALRLDFGRQMILRFRGTAIASDAGLMPYRELDDAVGLTDTDTLADARTVRNERHRLAGCHAGRCSGGSPATRT